MRNKYSLACLLVLLMIISSCTQKEIPPPPPGGTGNNGTGSGTGGNTNNPKPLVANAGPDQAVVLPQNSVILNGDRSFDSSGRVLSFSWRMLTGPSSARIIDSSQSRTLVENLVAGSYTFELKVSVSNPYAFSLDTTRVTVYNPPVANAGPDQSIVLPQNTVYLNGERSFDSSGQSLSFSWRMITGSSTASIMNPNQSRPIVQNLVAGIYTFELKVSVSNPYAFSLDTTQVTVQLPPNCQGNRPEITAQLNYLGEVPDIPEFPEMIAVGNHLLIPRYWDWGAGQVSSLIHIYNTVTRNWSVTTLPIAREGMCLAVAGNKVYFAGGLIYDPVDLNRYTLSSRIDIYDAGTGTWTLAQLSEPRAYCKAALAGNKLVIAGGLKANDAMSAKVDILDLATNSWTFAQLAGGPRAVAAAVTVQSKIFFCGGLSKFENPTGFGYFLSTPVRAIDIYDVNTGQWSGTVMQNAKSNFSAQSYQNKLYLAGGEFENGFSYDVEIIDATTLQSTSACLSSTAVFYSPSTSCIKNTDILFFPSYNESSFKNKMDIYHTTTGTWSVSKLPVTHPSGFSDLSSAVMLPNALYVIFNKKLYSMTL